MSDKITNLTADTFDEAINGAEGPVLVDFWAEWCGPCKQIAPVLDELADEYGDRLSIGKVNVDEAGELAQRFQVMSIPTLIVFNDGDVANRIVGARGKAQLKEELDQHV